MEEKVGEKREQEEEERKSSEIIFTPSFSLFPIG